MDDYFSSDEVKDQLFGKSSNKYEYNPIVRKASDENGDDQAKINLSYKPPYIKIKIDLDYNTNTPKLTLFDKDFVNNTRNAIDI